MKQLFHPGDSDTSYASFAVAHVIRLSWLASPRVSVRRPVCCYVTLPGRRHRIGGRRSNRTLSVSGAERERAEQLKRRKKGEQDGGWCMREKSH